MNQNNKVCVVCGGPVPAELAARWWTQKTCGKPACAVELKRRTHREWRRAKRQLIRERRDAKRKAKAEA